MKLPVHRRSRFRVAFLTVARVLAALSLMVWLPASAGGLLWRVSGGSETAFLLGSMHFGSDDMYPLHPRIEQAMARAERVMVEVNLLKVEPTQLAAAIGARGAQPPGQMLRNQLSEDLWQALFRLSRKLGVPAATFQRQQPWLAALTLGSISVLQLGLNETRGVDLHVMNRVNGRVPIMELESFDAQIRLLSEIPLQQQIALLDAAVRRYDEGQALVKRILDAWRLGDGQRLARLIAEDTALGGPEAARLKTRLLDHRNRDMAQRIAEQLELPGPVLVVVGAAHLVGHNSIVEQLALRGYSVVQVATGPQQ